MRGLFPGTSSPPNQSIKIERYTRSVTTRWPTNINVVPIDYAFRPRLRDRLTLRRLTLRRNPWTYGDSVSHTVYRYSCQHSHLPYLQLTLQSTFTGVGNAPLPRIRKRMHPHLRCMVLAPLHFRRRPAYLD